MSAMMARPLFAFTKSPKLSSVPAGMAAGLICTTGPLSGWAAGTVMTCAMPAGIGAVEQKLPDVTLAGMPSWARSRCRVAGSNSASLLRVSVAVPLACLTRVNAAVWIVPGPGPGPAERDAGPGDARGRQGAEGLMGEGATPTTVALADDVGRGGRPGLAGGGVGHLPEFAG
jgi:hypothetical protein